MNGPTKFIEHLAFNNYHPRSDAHSNAIGLAVLGDLLTHCEPIARKAARGELVAKLNHTVSVNYEDWNIDLAMGPPLGSPEPPGPEAEIRFDVPAVIEIAVEAKGVMTEHGKARHNRLRDFRAFHQHAHTYNKKVIAAGVVVVNVAKHYWSPTRLPTDITIHRNIERVGAETVALYRNLPLRNDPNNGPGIEAMTVLVVEHDNLGKHPRLPPEAPQSHSTLLVTRAPAPQPGDPLHWATMIQRICRAYAERWS